MQQIPTRNEWTPLGHPFPENHIPSWFTFGGLVSQLILAIAIFINDWPIGYLIIATGLFELGGIFFNWNVLSGRRKTIGLIISFVIFALGISSFFA